MVLPAGQLSSLDFGSYEEMKKQRWTCIDILKCLAALAVVEIHKPLKVQSGAELLILCRFAVPVFFMITGFFYSETVAHRRELKQIGKILTITIGANLFYLIWKVLLALKDENNIKDALLARFEERMPEDFILWNFSPLSPHLWYLQALVYVLDVYKRQAMDSTLGVAFDVLDYALLSAPGAPLKQALLDAGIGKEIYGDYSDGVLQPFFSIVAKGAKTSQKEKFVSVIRNCLQDIVRNGIDKKAILAGINYMEFRYREADFGQFPKGLMYGLDIMGSWLYDCLLYTSRCV